MRQPVLRGLHVLALGLWFGGAAFFNFIAAVPIFESFKKVVNDGPSDRTADETIIPPNDEAGKKGRSRQRSGRRGRRTGLSAILRNASGVRADRAGDRLELVEDEDGRKVHRWRVYLIAAGVLTIAVGWPISEYVSELRLARFSIGRGGCDRCQSRVRAVASREPLTELRDCMSRGSRARSRRAIAGGTPFAQRESRLTRFLLRHAVQRAETPDQIDAVDADNLAVGEQFGERSECNAVRRVVEGRHDHDPVRDVEVRVTCR